MHALYLSYSPIENQASHMPGFKHSFLKHILFEHVFKSFNIFLIVFLKKYKGI